MTSPSKQTPAGFLNGYGGIKAWSEKTRGEYENEILGKVNTSTQKVKLFGEQAAMTEEKAMTAAEDAAAAAALAAVNEEANIKNAGDIAEANLQIGTKVDPEKVPTDVPGWVALNPVEDATFPRTDLVPVPTIVNDKSGTQVDDNGGVHRHFHNASITWVDPVYTTVLKPA
ncbi:hypothetical protein GS482_12995, partial [Rhodococcus hoagii]|nr:hypothetical protein [Prescottella equi]